MSANWKWSDYARSHWVEAPPEWQQFANKWRSVEEEVLHPEPPVLDLGPEKPQNIPIDRIYIRECYEEGVRLVWDRATVKPSAGATGVIFTGQPGTGKTVFIWYLLIRLLQAKQVVLFHVHEPDFLLFYHDKVYISTSAKSTISLPIPPANSTYPSIWSLFDLSRKEEPARSLTAPPCFPIQTTSPNETRYKTWQKERSPTLTGFPTWTPEELAACASHDVAFLEFKERLKAVVESWPVIPRSEASAYPGLFGFLKATHGQDALGSAEQAFDILFDALIAHYGPIPREVFSAMYNFKPQEDRHESALFIGPEPLREIVRELNARKHFPNTTTFHCVIALYSSGVGVDTTWKIEFKSDYIARRVSDGLHDKFSNEVRELISYFSSVPQAKTLAGQLFEPFVHCLIAEGHSGARGIWPFRHNASNWTLKQMTLEPRDNLDSPIFVLPDHPVAVSGFPNVPRTQDVFDSVNIPHDLSNDMYYVASMSNLPFFDSFVVNLDFSTRSAHLWILQMTTSADHRGSARGYVVVHKIMRRIKELLRNAPPPAKKSKKVGVEPSRLGGSGMDLSDVVPLVHVHYVLVRPRGEGRSTWKLPKGWNEAVKENDHRGLGYVLDIPLVADQSKLFSAGERVRV